LSLPSAKSWIRLNMSGVPVWFKPSHIWILYFEWLQSQQYELSNFPPSTLQATLH
jgi:hypothetical protein